MSHAVVCPFPQAACVCGFVAQHGGLAGVAPRHAAPARSPAHDRLIRGCPVCGAPPYEQCVSRDGKALASTYVHSARLR